MLKETIEEVKKDIKECESSQSALESKLISLRKCFDNTERILLHVKKNRQCFENALRNLEEAAENTVEECLQEEVKKQAEQEKNG